MCINKLRIINKGYRPFDFRTSQFIDVNCGHCIQCQSSRQSAFAYRLQQEVFSHDCIPFFVTLTYSPLFLPMLYYYNDDFELKSISVWNRQHVQRFNKVLRRQLEYYFGIVNAFKYLCCCERGTDRIYLSDSGRYRVAQQLPHFHLMYVLYNPDSFKPIRELPDGYIKFLYDHRKEHLGVNLRSFFHYLIQSRWYYGNVKDLEVTRDVASCTRYVSMYCTKNINENLFDIPINRIHSLKDFDFEMRSVKRQISAIKLSHLKPLCSQSSNLGFDSSKTQFYADTISDNKLVPLVGTIRSNNIPLPFYYFNKIGKFTFKIPENCTYSYHDGIRNHKCVHVPFYRRVLDWDNIRGAFVDVRKKVYTSTFYTNIGNKIRDKLFYNKIDRQVKSLVCMLRNKDYFSNLYDKFLSLDKEVFNGFSYLFYPRDSIKDSLSWLSSHVKVLPRLLKEFSHLDRVSLFSISGDYKHIDILLKTFSLCRTTHSYLNQVTYRELFKKRLTGVALKDPQLLLPHFININTSF